jgi:hypothetical protein
MKVHSLQKTIFKEDFMKHFKILAILLLTAMFSFFALSCGGGQVAMVEQRR